MINKKYLLFNTAPRIMWLISATMMVAAMYTFYSVKILILEWHLLSLMSTPLNMTFIADPVGLFYSAVVLFISGNVLQFSKFYMKDDMFINRFTILVILFVLSMNALIFIPHMMALLLGWDGLGITSFILVIYYQNPKSLAAGMITALTNRIGDVMILLAIALTLNQGHWNIIHMWETTYLWPQIFTLMIAAMTKSAQMPFSSWLPAAMAAPTPVSALVHSSTLVTAGVFLMIRFYPFLSTLKAFNFTILFIAVCTMLMAGISATTECDMKKIIALSTLSQLGMMMTAIGLGLPNMAMFHMVMHALFKALLFICAGELISLHAHGQELRWMGNLVTQAPVASSCILLANMALCGIPFMAGFYSKDLILELMLSNLHNSWMVLITLCTVGFTSFYSVRFTMVTVWGPCMHGPLSSILEDKNVIIPMLIMSTSSVCGGAATLWLLPYSCTSAILPMSLKLLPLMMVSLGFMTAWALTMGISPKQSLLLPYPMLNSASCLMWFLVPMASQLQLKTPLSAGHAWFKSVDHAWLELMSGQGMFTTITKSSNTLLTIGPKSATTFISTGLLLSTLVLITTSY